MTKKFAFLISFSLVLCLSTLAAKANEIAVIDFNLLFRDSLVGQSVIQHVESQSNELQVQVNAWQQELKTEEEQLRQQQSILDPKSFREKLRQFEAKQVRVKRAVNAINRKIAELRDLGRRQVIVAIREILAAKAQSGNYKVVLDKAVPFYLDESVDLTASVLTDLNQKVTSVTLPRITLEEQGAAQPAQ